METTQKSIASPYSKGTRHSKKSKPQAIKKSLSAWNRHVALLDLAQHFSTNGESAHLTQLEYDLAEDKNYSAQFFVQHWGSWTRAVEKARGLVDPQKHQQPTPSPYAGYVFCICEKACHCQKRFWSPDRRKIRMCDPCRSWTEKISVDQQFFSSV